MLVGNWLEYGPIQDLSGFGWFSLLAGWLAVLPIGALAVLAGRSARASKSLFAGGGLLAIMPVAVLGPGVIGSDVGMNLGAVLFAAGWGLVGRWLLSARAIES